MSNKQTDFLSHFPDGVSDALRQYAIDTVFLESRYLFVWRVKKVQIAFCTHCHVEYPLGVGQAAFGHNEKTTCLNCQSECTVKQRGRGRSHLIDGAYVVWYEKSVKDPNVVIARGFDAHRDYSGDYHNVETQFVPRALYTFEPGKGGRYFRKDWHAQWAEAANVASVHIGNGWFTYKPAFCSLDSIEQAVAGTQLQYSEWREYEEYGYDLVQYLALAAKYPCVEYLTKMGLQNVVVAKLNGNRTYRVVNWRGKSLEKVLRLTRPELRQLKAIASSVKPETLYSYHYWPKLGVKVSLEDAKKLVQLTDGYGDYYSKMLKESGGEAEVAQYILKQLKRPKGYTSATTVLTQWRDYLRMSTELGIDQSAPGVRFPSNLHEAHDKVMMRVKIKKDEKLNAKIATRLHELQKYAFTDGEFLIRPATSSIELFAEGKALNHCVGGYSADYAEGKSDLYLVRKTEAPDSALVTVEVVSGKIRQARGFKNRTTNDLESEFLKRFEAHLRKVNIQLKSRPKRIAG